MLRRVVILDRVLDRNNMAASVLVTISNTRSLAGGLAAASATDEQHQATLAERDFFQRS